jgi:hypothetical protein
VRRALVVPLLCLGALLPTTALGFQLGIGEQRQDMFTDPHFLALHIHDVRHAVPWDVLSQPRQLVDLDRWMKEAHALNIDVLLTFQNSVVNPDRLPDPAQMTKVFRTLRQRYPWVLEWATWSEPNLATSPLRTRPERAAAYWKQMTASCPQCRVLAAEMLDTHPSMSIWVRQFVRAAGRQPKYWGLHDYVDANRFRFAGTRELLRETKGQVWLTETGGIVDRPHHGRSLRRVFPESRRHAAQVTRFLLTRLARVSHRIRRLYLYEWKSSGRSHDWDTGLLNADGTPRPAYRVVRKYSLKHR